MSLCAAVLVWRLITVVVEVILKQLDGISEAERLVDRLVRKAQLLLVVLTFVFIGSFYVIDGFIHIRIHPIITSAIFLII